MRECPFCGNKTSVDLFADYTYRGAHHIEPYDEYLDYYVDKSYDGVKYAFVCSIEDGGCGASSGRYDSIDEAEQAWDRRNGVTPWAVNDVLHDVRLMAKRLQSNDSKGMLEAAVSLGISTFNEFGKDEDKELLDVMERFYDHCWVYGVK